MMCLLNLSFDNACQKTINGYMQIFVKQTRTLNLMKNIGESIESE